MNNIYYGETDSVYILKLVGALRFNQCATLEYFLKTLLPKNPPPALGVDLSQATLLDSTALGLLAQIAIKFKDKTGKTPDLYCPENDLKQVLLSMSLEQLFNFTKLAPKPTTLPELSVKSDNQDAQTQRVLSAHETLMGLSEKNKQEFKSVVDMLQDTLNAKTP